ncbi:unnamed protein product [Adineta steineri]|uniref:Exonuclease domain-containing protein n=1 Tax=Adineta steineri TaxID=433720 RepID=A0A814M8G5_9BILA|nr:unnamed protein product [Adineta steineri]CAF1075810.1 unnamed protein product [Adineta steineri]
MNKIPTIVDATRKHNDVEVERKRIRAVRNLDVLIQLTNDSEKSSSNKSPSSQLCQILSIDVGCVATGYSHLDRAPCCVAIVNDRCEIIFNSLIKPDKPVVSDLLPFSGVRTAELRDAPSFDEVLEKVHSFFTPTTLIVGQSVMSDIEWMKLEQGVHYNSLIELDDEFTTFDPKYGIHEAYVLLNIDLNAVGGHVAKNDAKASIKLYNEYLKDKNQSKLGQAQNALLKAPTKIPLFRQFSGSYEGVCLSAFNRGYCRCGQPLISELHKQTNEKKRRNSNDRKEEGLSTSIHKKMKVLNKKSQS